MYKNKLLWISLVISTVFLISCSDTASTNGPPSTSDLNPEDEMTPYIERGEELLEGSMQVMADEETSELSCMSCHSDGSGTNGVSFVGVVSEYPQYNERTGTVITLAEKINRSISRTLNSEELDYEGEEMRSIIAYLNYISEGESYEEHRNEEIADILEPDLDNGKRLYNDELKNTAPALWGDDSFTDGSNMSRMSVMTNYVKNYLPVDESGTFSDQEASDIAGYVLSKDRPEWEDWSKEEKPTDLINKEEREAIKKGEFDWSMPDAY